MWRRHSSLFGVTAIVVGVFAALLFNPGHSYAANGINQELSFEGKIVTAAGINIPDGTYNMQFQIYTGCTNNTGSGCTSVWLENWLVGTNPVTFSSGTFQANLGSQTAFASSVPWGTNPLYLSIEIGNTSSPTGSGCATETLFVSDCGGDSPGVMTPYILLTSTPYAFNSSELNGLAASSYGQLASSNAYQPTTNVTGVTVLQNTSGSPTADIFDVQTVNNSDAIQVTGPSLNNANVVIQSVGSGGSLTLGSQTSTQTINLGSVGTATNASTIDIGSSTGAAQTINIGGLGGSSGTSNSGSNTDIEGGQTDINVANAGSTIQTYTNSSTALQVENSNGNSILTVNTSTPAVSANGAFTSTGVITADDTTDIQDAGASTNSLTVYNNLGIPIVVAGSNNLLINGDFESGTSGWTATGTGASIAQNTNPTYVYSGSSSLAITVGTTANVGATVSTFNNALPAGTYVLNFYAKTATAFSTLEASFTGSSAGCTLNSSTVSTSAWTNYNCTVTTSSSITALNIESSGTTALTFYVDAVQIVSNSNLVSNPGFESPLNTTDWSATGTGATIALNQNRGLVYFGQASLDVTTGSVANSGAQTSTYIAASLPATTYTLSFFAEGTTAFTTLQASLGSGTCTLNSNTVSTTGFQEYTCTATTTGSPTIEIGSSGTTPVTFYLDDVQLVSGSSLQPYNIGQIQLRGIIDNPVIFQGTSNSTVAFQLENASGLSILAADTLDNRITLGTGAGASATVLVLGVKTDTGDPSTCTNGGIYYNSNSNLFRACQNGTWIRLINAVTVNCYVPTGVTLGSCTAGTTSTWNAPSGVGISAVEVIAVGGGGGGGGGQTGATDVARGGGGGGGGGAYASAFYSAGDVGTGITVTPGSAGTAGAAAGSGGNGGNSSFGSFLLAYGGAGGTSANGGVGGGGGGTGGAGSGVTGGSPLANGSGVSAVGGEGAGGGASTIVGGSAEYGGGGGNGGASGTATTTTGGGGSLHGGGGGGGGAGCTTANATDAGKPGGLAGSYAQGTGAAVGVAGTGGNSTKGGGGAGGNNTPNCASGTGGGGLAGGVVGGGGSGGAAGVTGGVGGAGGAGVVWVISW